MKKDFFSMDELTVLENLEVLGGLDSPDATNIGCQNSCNKCNVYLALSCASNGQKCS